MYRDWVRKVCQELNFHEEAAWSSVRGNQGKHLQLSLPARFVFQLFPSHYHIIIAIIIGIIIFINFTIFDANTIAISAW